MMIMTMIVVVVVVVVVVTAIPCESDIVYGGVCLCVSVSFIACACLCKKLKNYLSIRNWYNICVMVNHKSDC